jgi:hypothetical protein
MKNVILSLVLLATTIVILNTQKLEATELSNSIVCVPCGK